MASQSGVPTREQSISFEGRDLTNSKSTMAELGVGDDAVLLLRRKVTVAGRYVVSSQYNHASILISIFIQSLRSMEQDSEMMRLQILGDPRLMHQLREVCVVCYL